MTTPRDWTKEAPQIISMGRDGWTGLEMANYYHVTPTRMYQVLRDLKLFESKSDFGRGRKAVIKRDSGAKAYRKMLSERLRVLQQHYPELHPSNIHLTRECPITGLMIDYRARRNDWQSLRILVTRTKGLHDEPTKAQSVTRLGKLLHELPITPTVWNKVLNDVVARDPHSGLLPEDIAAIQALQAHQTQVVTKRDLPSIPAALQNSAWFKDHIEAIRNNPADNGH